jgi:diguanylate cyclase (GGDEF)-like protein
VFKLGPGQILLSSIGNALYIVGHFGILAGLRRQLGLAAGWNWIAAAGVLVAALHTLPFVHDSMVHRLCLFTPVVVAINLTAARLLWRHPDREARLACMPLIVLELFFSLELVTRASYVVFGASLPSFVGSQFLQTSGSLFVLVFLSVATMSCAQVVMHQQALALRRASMTDVLTGWLNRRALIDIAAREFARSRRNGKAMYVIVFDIDHFKAVNDRHGHAVGDDALCHVTALASSVLRGCDALFRTGGEEFAVLLLDATDAAQARTIAERLREQIESHPLHTGGCAVPMTVSVGLAALDAADAAWEDVLARADNALYHAKQHGRNRVSVANGAGAVCEQAVA